MDEARYEEGWYNPEKGLIDICSCTLLRDGWVCLECKDMQNQEAVGSGSITCFAEGCSEPLEADKDRRKICLWCNRPLPVVRVGGETRQVWNQKIVAAKKVREESRRADLEEYNRTRLKQLRMSRRELRGDAAVEVDPDADKAQFVRHLDTVNYNRFMDRNCAPSGAAIYASKAGMFTYSRPFLSRFRYHCDGTRETQAKLKWATSSPSHEFARTNLEKHGHSRLFIPPSSAWRNSKPLWNHLKAHILQLHVSERKSLLELQRIMHQEYDFLAPTAEYVVQLRKWEHYPAEDDEDSVDANSSTSSTVLQNEAESSSKTQEDLDRSAAEKLQAEIYAEDMDMSNDSKVNQESLLQKTSTSCKKSGAFESDVNTLFLTWSAPDQPSPTDTEMGGVVVDELAGRSGEEREEPPSYLESLGL